MTKRGRDLEEKNVEEREKDRRERKRLKRERMIERATVFEDDLYLLLETASGYAIFVAPGLDAVSDLVVPEFLREDFEIISRFVNFCVFLRFSSSELALNELVSVSRGLMTDQLRYFLELNLPKVKEGKKFSLGVSELEIGLHISAVTKIYCKSNKFVLELLRGVRLHCHRFIKDLKPCDLEKAQLLLGHNYSRGKIKFNVNRVDHMLIQAILLLDTLDKDVNSFSMTVQAAKSTGEELNLVDQINAKRLDSLVEHRTKVYNYVVTKMNDIAPGLAALVGELVGARLISHTGGLENLAKLPSSTLQILGAEKTLYRALRTTGKTPKYGYIYHSYFVFRASTHNKGRIARCVANKCALASRNDCFSDQKNADFGKRLRIELEEMLQKIETKSAENTMEASSNKEKLTGSSESISDHSTQFVCETGASSSSKPRFNAVVWSFEVENLSGLFNEFRNAPSTTKQALRERLREDLRAVEAVHVSCRREYDKICIIPVYFPEFKPKIIIEDVFRRLQSDVAQVVRQLALQMGFKVEFERLEEEPYQLDIGHYMQNMH